MALTPSLLAVIERKTGETIAQLQEETLSARRAKIAIISGKTLHFTRRFPFVGRGTVMSEHLLSHEEVEKQFEEAIR
jgi:hypothetical protein